MSVTRHREVGDDVGSEVCDEREQVRALATCHDIGPGSARQRVLAARSKLRRTERAADIAGGIGLSGCKDMRSVRQATAGDKAPTAARTHGGSPQLNAAIEYGHAG